MICSNIVYTISLGLVLYGGVAFAQSKAKTTASFSILYTPLSQVSNCSNVCFIYSYLPRSWYKLSKRLILDWISSYWGETVIADRKARRSQRAFLYRLGSLYGTALNTNNNNNNSCLINNKNYMVLYSAIKNRSSLKAYNTKTLKLFRLRRIFLHTCTA